MPEQDPIKKGDRRSTPHGASADFLPARPPARRVDRRQHVAFALSRDRQRMPGVQKIEEAIFQRVPFIHVKLGMTELRLVEKRQIGRHFDFGRWKDVAGEVHLRLAVGDRDRAGGVLFWPRARIDRIHIEMRPAIDAEYCPATGVVIGQHRVIPAVDLEFPGAFPDIACRECLGQTEAEYNGSNSKQPWIHRNGEPPTRVSANILAQARATKSPARFARQAFYPFKSPTSASGTTRTSRDVRFR